LLESFSRAKAKAGDRVLVHGASGAVGLAACQMAKAHGKFTAINSQLPLYSTKRLNEGNVLH